MSSGGGERESLASLYRSALMSGAQAAKSDARSDEAHVSDRFSFQRSRYFYNDAVPPFFVPAHLPARTFFVISVILSTLTE